MAIPLGTLAAQALLIGEGTAAIKASTGFTLDSTESFLSSSTQPRAIVRNSVDTTLTTATFTVLTWDTEDTNVGSLHNTGVNPSRITIPTGGGGLYLFLGQVVYAGNVTGQRQGNLLKNGAGTVYQGVTGGSAAFNPTVQTQALLVAAAGDFFELQAYQDSGGNLAVDHTKTYFAAVKLW